MTAPISHAAPRSYPEAVHVIRREGPIVCATSDTYAAISTWLLEEASSEREMIRLLMTLIGRLKGAGSSIDRLTLHVGTLHPQLVGFAWVWNVDDGFCDEVRVTDAALDSDAYTRNPLQRILDDGETIRRSPAAPDAQAEFPIMFELAAIGMADYLALPLPGLDTRNVITIATRHETGFGEIEIETLRGLFRVFALHVQRHSELKISENALAAYLGAGAAAKVLKGAIKRGAGDSVRAVIWVSDLRDFTGLSDVLPSAEMLELLNGYFEAMANAVGNHGGEVLKFIGDGMLAVFPIAGGLAETSRAAVAAAVEAIEGLDAFNRSRGAVNSSIDVQLRAGIALHEGEVFFGNVGSPDRLDFTVIGPAVNEACRIEALTRSLGRPLLFTSVIASHLASEAENLGSHHLKGVSEPVTVFGLSKAPTSNTNRSELGGTGDASPLSDS